MTYNPLLLIDFYKAGHYAQYPSNTIQVYSNWTARYTRMADQVDKVVFFGLQYYILEYLIKNWNENFFHKPKAVVLAEYDRYMTAGLGSNVISLDHIGELHDFGYLPLEIRALPEGTRVPLKVPMFTVHNTQPKFYWLTNYIESNLSNILWKPCTSATIAWLYRKNFNAHREKTGYNASVVPFQAHDFSYRGMGPGEDAVLSAAGHLLSFTGTDTVMSLPFMERYYKADVTKELVGGSIPATEHSVMCMWADYKNEIVEEFETFKYLITKLYPKGYVSIVSDTFDLWKVLTGYIPRLKTEILARDGRVVIRPDSGNPVDIICGFDFGSEEAIRNGILSVGQAMNYTGKSATEVIGAYELLWNTFDGTINANGYKVLDPHIGLIYGDAITLERQSQILDRLERKRFSASNLALGVGSYTYVHQTRDVFGFAMKATAGMLRNEDGTTTVKEIFKDPITDRGIKKSAKGYLQVHKNSVGEYILEDCCKTYEGGELKVVFKDGKLLKQFSLEEVRQNLLNS